jgi:hypothetical protein
MEILTPVKKLDAVLKMLKLKSTNYDGLRTHFKGTEIDADEVRRLANKLEKDGYIEIDAAHNCVLTFEGLLFGGYENKIEAEKANQIATEKDHRRRQRNQAALVSATWVVGVAVVLLVLWQIFIYLYPVHANYPRFLWEK